MVGKWWLGYSYYKTPPFWKTLNMSMLDFVGLIFWQHHCKSLSVARYAYVFATALSKNHTRRNSTAFSVIHTSLSVGVQSPTGIKASGGWQRCADEDVALMCDAHLAGNNAEALLNYWKEQIIVWIFLNNNLTYYSGLIIIKIWLNGWVEDY